MTRAKQAGCQRCRAIALELHVSERPEKLRGGLPVATQAAGGRDVDYVAYLRHRGILSSHAGGAA